MNSEPKYYNTFEILSRILKSHLINDDFRKILVVGCAEGEEALEIAKNYQTTDVTGIDPCVDVSLSQRFDQNVHLIKGDFLEESFGTKEFDLIYCYHVLEHIKNKSKALSLMGSLLNNHGILFIGFPNRKCLIRYINPIHKFSFFQKIRMNFIDMNDRLRKTGENHLGLSQEEFIKLASNKYSSIQPVGRSYYFFKYPRLTSLIKIIGAIGLDKYFFPSIYFICKK